MSEREFICDIEPTGDGSWELWISEEPYFGVKTDAVCSHFSERQGSSGCYTSRWYIGKSRFRWVAVGRAKRVIRRAVRLAARNDVRDAQWRARATRNSVRVAAPRPDTQGVEG